MQLALFGDSVSAIVAVEVPKKVREEYDNSVKELRDRFERHQAVLDHGTHDPFWPDGCNANLVRNHILYYKNKIKEFNKTYSLVLPEDFYRPTPEEVSNEYMAPNSKAAKHYNWN